jgi:membrane fusion protein (multidrug efflux system)
MASVVKQIAVVAMLAAGAYGGWTVWQARSGQAQEQAQRPRSAPGVVVAPVTLERVERVVNAVGAARPVRSVELATLSDGRIARFGFEGGDRVEAGQMLLELDDAAERASVQEAQANLARAQNAFDRALALRDQRRIAESEFDTARAELLRAEAVLERARKDLEDRTLTAPFAGVAGFRRADVGAVVRSNTPIADLADISALDVDFSIPERFYGEVRVGAEVRAATEIFPGEAFGGTVTAVSARVDTVSRSFTARARIPNPDYRLPADAFMRVTLVLAARESVVAPEEAVVSEGGENFVYVIADDRAQRRRVTVGSRSAGRAEIAEGVAAGEMVVVRGVQKVGDNRPVRVLNAPPAATPVAAAGSGA